MRISPVAFLRTDLMQNDKNLQKTSVFNLQPNDISFGSNTKIIGTKLQNIVEWLGRRSTPFNRFLLGAIAFSTQPWIDLYNPDVDKETQKMSCIRTIAKVVIGTATGVAVRVLCIGAMDKYTRTIEELKGRTPTKLESALIPTTISYEDFCKASRVLKKHRQALGSFVAIAAMMITDPPLTVFLTNFFNNQRKQLEQKKKVSAPTFEGGKQ